MAIALAPYGVQTTKKEVKVPADLVGVKLRSAGGIWNDVIESIQGTPVVKTAAEYFESIQRGVVDGSVTPINAILAFKVEPLMKYAVDVQLGQFAFDLAINEKVWQTLPQMCRKL